MFCFQVFTKQNISDGKYLFSSNMFCFQVFAKQNISDENRYLPFHKILEIWNVKFKIFLSWEVH